VHYDEWLIKFEKLRVEDDDICKKEANDAIAKAEGIFYDFYDFYKMDPCADKFLVKYFGAEYHTRRLNSIGMGHPSNSSPDKDKADKYRIKDPIIKGAIVGFIEEIDYKEELILLSELREIHRIGKEEPTVGNDKNAGTQSSENDKNNKEGKF